MTATTTNRQKTQASIGQNRQKNAASLKRRVKAGRSWTYGEIGYTYGIDQAPFGAGTVGYGQVGTDTSSSIKNKIKN